MNGPFAREAARKLVNAPPIKGAKTPDDKLDALFLAAFARKPTEKERTRFLAFIASGPEADRWLDLSHGLLMANEFTFID
jgi:hypothetical protein